MKDRMGRVICRRCNVILSTDNARRYGSSWVGMCRRCESVVGVARARASRTERPHCGECGRPMPVVA